MTRWLLWVYLKSSENEKQINSTVYINTDNYIYAHKKIN